MAVALFGKKEVQCAVCGKTVDRGASIRIMDGSICADCILKTPMHLDELRYTSAETMRQLCHMADEDKAP